MADLTRIDEKLAKTIAGTVRRLTSDKPGEVVAAIEAFGRLLQNAGADIIHCVADRIEHHSGLTDDEMKAVFAAGAEWQRKQAKQAARINGGIFPPAHDMAMWCRQQDRQLNDWERNFINSMAARSLAGDEALSPRMEEKLRGIFLRTGGPML